MTGFARAALVFLLLLAPLAAPVHGGGVVYYSYSYPAYYQPVYAYYPSSVAYYVPTVSYYYATTWPVYETPVYCAPSVVVPATAYAVPTAAPPSQTAEPPLGTPKGAAPKVIESRPEAAPYKSAKVSGAGAGERVQVGFWNVSGRDLTLTIDGQARRLARNRSLTLTVGRQFVWRVDERAPQTERVPDGSSTMEIVVRQ